jgi:acetyl-CoA acetyltransferase
MATDPFAGVYIAGCGQTLYEKRSPKKATRLIFEAADTALRSAGVAWSEVDGLAVTSFNLPPDNVTTLAEHFGIEARFLFQGVYGGASGIIGMMHAARAVRDGDADVVLCAAADAYDVASHNETLDRFNGSVQNYMSPHGFGGANGMFALHTRLYMERYGAKFEDFGTFCIALRKNAGKNPNALLRAPMTMEDYLGARQIADPLRLYDCVLPCVGGDCVLLVSERIASRLRGPLVRIRAGGEYHNYPAGDVYSLSAGWAGFSPRMYERAGLGPQDMEFAQLYDDYPVMCFIQLEGLGLAPKGSAFQFVRDTDITTSGSFPINTGGGQLSAGQAGASGGMIGVYEAVVQLRGEAGERQVTCRRGLVSGYGMIAYGRGLSASAAILERVN